MEDIQMVGPALEEGPLPALIYFTLSGKDSLHTAPYNEPVKQLCGSPIRIFSWDLPFHPVGITPDAGLKHIHDALQKGEDIVTPFIDESCKKLDRLIDEGWITPKKIAVAGLSRGAFFATHLSAKHSHIHHILGFAPLTNLLSLEVNNSPLIESLNLHALIPQLLHKSIRFFIGNHDERVKTDYAYAFIRTIAEASFAKRTRHHAFEIKISPSIGFKGHGTSDAIFHEGADWIKRSLL